MNLKFLPIFVLFIGLFACSKSSDQIEIKNVEKPTDFYKKISYVIGRDIGKKMHDDSLKIDMTYLFAGIQNGFKNDSSLFTDEEYQQIMLAFQDTMRAVQEIRMKAQQAEMQKTSEVNKQKVPQFLEENKKKPNIKTTASGLQYEVITEGKGDSPKKDEIVKVHYIGTLLNGTEFDNSYKRKQPATFILSQVIPGWQEGIQLMKPGAKYKFYIPPELAYGEQGSPPRIPPYSLLIFEVEFLGVEKPNNPAK